MHDGTIKVQSTPGEGTSFTVIRPIVVAKKIRQQSDLHPIIFISTKHLLEDKVKGYLTGAGDYITKPFSMKELLLKIEVFLRWTKKDVCGEQTRIFIW